MKNIAADTPVRQIFDVYQGAVLPILLKDKTTGKNILWATDEYDAISPKSEIEFRDITGGSLMLVRPRIAKTLDAQRDRTKKRAEVFTPSWICNQMNNALDDDYLGYAGAFNEEGDRTWTRNRKKIQFGEGKSWQEYIDQTRLEITCGEAPFVTSRYNPTDGNFIEVKDRIGFLDRKLRVAEENADGDEYKKWSMRSLESCYGYEYQGDNLLIARINVFLTWTEHWEKKLGEKPDRTTARSAANVIAWNFWQMDGLTGRIPQIKGKDCGQMTLPGFEAENETGKPDATEECLIFDWRNRHRCVFKYSQDLQLFKNKGEWTMKKFFAVIGNPPYQDESSGEQKNFAPPIYNSFMDEAYKVAEKVTLVTPARFLFNAGSTPKKWNEKMLADKHLKVLKYEADGSRVFPNTDIKGGIAVTHRDESKDYGAIGTFTAFEELNGILKKVLKHPEFKTFSDIVFSRTEYRFNDKMHKEHPEAKNQQSKGHLYDVSTNIFDILPQLFYEKEPIDKKEYIQILGLNGRERLHKYVRRDFINPVTNLDFYKIFVPKANGSGALGEVLSTPLIGQPLIGHTETFISIGVFKTKKEADACLKYVKGKFARVMLGILKATQDNPPAVWKYVPLQDFTSKSDIDWTKSVHEIDLQLYKKYGLSKEERDFIESHVKEMA